MSHILEKVARNFSRGGKGVELKAGFKTLFLKPNCEGIALPPDSLALHVIQHIRNDSHNNAITGHRNKCTKVKKY
ncbi:MAG: hypothetical protein ACTXOO_00555 [Sodalis sp. (in: enterobacteria)]